MNFLSLINLEYYYNLLWEKNNTDWLINLPDKLKWTVAEIVIGLLAYSTVQVLDI
jgi:hypothetical protein